jgi:acetoin utilization deacetylase AcuC-like enzyme
LHGFLQDFYGFLTAHIRKNSVKIRAIRISINPTPFCYVQQYLYELMLKIAYSPVYKYELAVTHRFPMMKYELIQEQLIYEGTIDASQFFHPEPIAETLITQVHDADYWTKLRDGRLSDKEIRKIGFPMSPQLVHRSRVIAAGTIQCALYALKYGVSMNAAGGTHHAFTDHGEGFSMLNDVALAARYLIDNQLVKRILVVDLDVHQGNGTAEIFQKNAVGWNGQQGVYTFSMHGAKNYPVQKQQSHLDIGLPDGLDDKPYLQLLYENLQDLLTVVNPQFIFFNSGVDVLKTDKLGRLGLSMEGCRQRDKMVFETCQQNKIPIAVSMGGGYSERLATIVDAHANTFRMAQSVFF